MTRQELIDHLFSAYSAEPEFPFPRDDESCVFRHANNRKWFALIMKVPFRTLGLAREGLVDILNVKCDPLLIGSLRRKPGFLPAYHMNKDKWLTVLLDGSAEREDITALVAMSYDLTAGKVTLPRKGPAQREASSERSAQADGGGRPALCGKL